MVIGFCYTHIGKCFVIGAEFWGIYICLKMCWNRNLKNVTVEKDSISAICMVKSEVPQLNKYSSLIAAICKLLQQNWSVSINHAFRECNSVVDWLASFSYALPIGTYLLEEASDPVNQLLEKDAQGACYIRSGKKNSLR